MLWDWYFVDNNTGEEFFVETETKEEAIKIAKQYFKSPRCSAKYTPSEAEWYGLDTY